MKPKYATDRNNDGWAWSTVEILMIKKMFDNGASDVEISEELGRSPKSVAFMRQKHRIVSAEGRGNYKKRIWTEEDEEELVDMTKRCVKLTDIAKHFGVAHTTISKKLSELGLDHYHRLHCNCGKDKVKIDSHGNLKTKDRYESKFFSSCENAVKEASKCCGYILEYTLSATIGMDRKKRVQFLLRTGKDKECMRMLTQYDMPQRAISAKLGDEVIVAKDEIVKLFIKCENWKGEVFVDPKDIEEIENEDNE